MAGIFVLTGVLALAAIGLVYRAVPAPEALARRRTQSASRQWRRVLPDGQLLRLNFGIFALHAVQMAMFVAGAVHAARQRRAGGARTGTSICRCCWSLSR